MTLDTILIQRVRWMATGAAVTLAFAFSVAWWELGQSDAIADQEIVIQAARNDFKAHLGDAACYMCREDCRRFCEANKIPLTECVCDCDLECGQP